MSQKAIDTASFDDPQGRIYAALADVCGQAGLSPDGAQLIKFTNNAVFRLANQPVVVRIAGSQTVRERVSKIIAVAEWLARHDMPSVRLLPGPQPIEVNGHTATLWQQAPTGKTPPDGSDLARILRRFHALAPPDFALPEWRPITGIRRRIAETAAVTANEFGFLHDKCDQIEDDLDHLKPLLPLGPIHGDSFLGNLIPTAGGPIICDFDSAAIGPREWDLVPVAVGKLRFDYNNDAHQQLADGYGLDVTEWSGFPLLRQLRELQLVTSVIPVLDQNPALRPQWQHRLNTFRSGDLSAKWTPYR